MEQLRAATSVFPELRDLAISCCDTSHSTQGLVSIFGGASALRRLRVLTNQRSIASSGGYPFLTTLDLRDTSESVVLEVLAQCPRLLHLRAHLGPPPIVPVPLTPLTLGLHSLFLAAHYGFGAAPPMLKHLTLPQLRRLDLHHDPQFDALASFLARSRCVPDHLGIWINSENEARRELDQLLRMFPSLSSLDIHAGSHIIAVIHILGVLPGRVGALPDIVPKLRALTLTTWEDHFDYEYLLSFLDRRRTPSLHPVGLESFHLQLCEDEGDHAPAHPTHSIFVAFEKRAAEGLDIQVSSRNSRWPKERVYNDCCEYYPERSEYLPPQI
ncbi:hypothetical protein B0H19DRAFT_1182551 [Mycena capillaripes]|nr:hypothetical protein B0H19DRAFT_1182551 [Mycena capillaripes]